MTMHQISYPFAAIPNSIARGGHGAFNLAVLVVILSHGDCWASRRKLASEVGCGVTTIQKALDYWYENAPKLGFIFEWKSGLDYGGGPNHLRIIFPETMAQGGVRQTARGVRQTNRGCSPDEHKEDITKKITTSASPTAPLEGSSFIGQEPNHHEDRPPDLPGTGPTPPSGAAPPSQIALREIVNCYMDEQGFIPSQRGPAFKRHVAPAKRLLAALDGDLEATIFAIKECKRWSKSRAWTLETVLNHMHRFMEFSSYAPQP